MKAQTYEEVFRDLIDARREIGRLNEEVASLKAQLEEKYEYRHISEFIKTNGEGGVWLEIPWNDGWELCGAVVRRQQVVEAIEATNVD